MAKEISLADIEPAIEIFKAANIQAVQKVVARAEKRALAAGKRQHQGLKSMMRRGKIGKKLTKALDKAMDFHGRQAKGRPSIRLTAPDTGGRPYHFGYTVITKGQRKSTTSSARRAGTEGGAAAAKARGAETPTAGKAKKGRASRHRANTREGAHQIYTERDNALEDGLPLDDRPLGTQAMAFADGAQLDQEGVSPALGKEGGARSLDEPEVQDAGARQQTHGREVGQAWVEEGMSRAPGLSEEHGEAAAQKYIEDAAKVPKLRGNTASFGTIGDTLEERLRFWDLVHEHESDKGGRTQSRLVLELPHEASAQERHEIVRRYTDDMFRAKGLPYWASIHAPTKDNDDRNHHAHVVFTDRPASKMVDPTTGREEWDFAVAVTKETACRHKLVTHRYKQKRREDMRGRGWVKRARTHFAEVTNDVMVEAGKRVRYDPRSYKDMGLDASPMKNVKRIITDKAKDQTFVVMDAEWTRRMIEQEMRAAAIRRSGTFQALVRTEGLLENASKSAAAAEKAQSRLPAHLKMGMPTRLGTDLARRVTTAVLEGERERLSRRFVEEATERTLRNVIEATGPRPKGKAAGKVHDAANAPDAADLAELHAAAIEELTAHRRSSRLAASATARRMEVLRGLWGGRQPAAKVPNPLEAAGGTTTKTTVRAAPAPNQAQAVGTSSSKSMSPSAGEPTVVIGTERGTHQHALEEVTRPVATATVDRAATTSSTRNFTRNFVPNFISGGLARDVSARMAAMVADFDVRSFLQSQSFEQRTREAGEAARRSAEALAKMDGGESGPRASPSRPVTERPAMSTTRADVGTVSDPKAADDKPGARVRQEGPTPPPTDRRPERMLLDPADMAVSRAAELPRDVNAARTVRRESEEVSVQRERPTSKKGKDEGGGCQPRQSQRKLTCSQPQH